MYSRNQSETENGNANDRVRYRYHHHKGKKDAPYSYLRVLVFSNTVWPSFGLLSEVEVTRTDRAFGAAPFLCVSLSPYARLLPTAR